MTDGPNETGSFRRQIPPEGHVTLRFEKFSSFVEEYRAGISLGGVFIKTHHPRPIGTEVHFEFKLTDGFRLLHGQGIVVWQRLSDQGPEAPAGMGVRFTAIDESGRQLVLKLLEEQVKAGGAPFEVERVPDGAVATNSAATVQPDPLDDEEPTLVGASVQDLDPSLPSPSELPVQKQAELGFDAPWGKKLPGVPQDLLAEESDPEIDQAVSTIRPTVPAGGSTEAEEAAQPTAAQPATAQIEAPQQTSPEPVPLQDMAPEPSAQSAPPVSSNQTVTPVAPPIAKGDEPNAPEAGIPNPTVDFDLGTTEEPTVIGAAPAQVSPAVESGAQQGVLPLSTPPSEPSLSAPSPSPQDTPEVVATDPAAPSAPAQPDPSLEDSMMEAADEVEATVQLEDPVIDFDPPPEDISFDPGPASPDEAVPLSADPAPSPAIGDAGALSPQESQPAPDFSLPGPEFSFDEQPASATDGQSPAADPADPMGLESGLEPTAEMPTFEAPLPTANSAPSFDAPAVDAPSFEAPSFEASPPAMEELAAPAASGQPTSSTDILPTSGLPSFADAGADPNTEVLSSDPPAAGDLPAGSPSFEPPSIEAPSFGQAGAADFSSPSEAPALAAPTAGLAGGSSLFAQEGAEPAAGVEGAPAAPHAADFVDSWPSSDEDPDAWMEEGEDFTPPARKGAGRYLIALGLVTALVAAVYFFRAPLSGLVGLSSGAESQGVVSQTGNAGGPQGNKSRKPAKKGGKKKAAEASEPAAGAALGEDDSLTDADSLQEEVIEVGADSVGEDVGSGAEGLPEEAGQELDTDSETVVEPEPAIADPPRAAPTSQERRVEERTPAPAVGGARTVTGIDWNRGSQGTRVTIAFSAPVSANGFRHDPLGWAADREMVSLLGVENYPKGEISVGTDELRRIRLGFHPGQELRLVFDLGATGAAIQEIKPVGTRLEILIQ